MKPKDILCGEVRNDGTLLRQLVEEAREERLDRVCSTY